MNKDKMREEFEDWVDESPNQRYGNPVWEAFQRATEVERERCAKLCEKSDRHRGGYFAGIIRGDE